jgi:hypothetical protein
MGVKLRFADDIRVWSLQGHWLLIAGGKGKFGHSWGARRVPQGIGGVMSICAGMPGSVCGSCSVSHDAQTNPVATLSQREGLEDQFRIGAE